jgi:hypothetical protein
MRYAIVLLAAVVLRGQQAPPAAPQPATQPATQPADAPAPNRVEGKVINAANGEPVPRATVLLQSQNGPQSLNYMAETNGNGQFKIENVSPGKYAVSADRQGFLLQVAGAAGAPPPRVTVEDGQPLQDVIIRLNPLCVIAGRVVDDDGDPLRGVDVQAMIYSYVGGKKQLRNAEQTQTNDKGEFRLYGLRPGTVYLYATSNNNYRAMRSGETIRGPHPPLQAATYFPNTIDLAHATPIELAAGAQLRGFDIHMRRDRVYTIRGNLPEAMDRVNGMAIQVMARDVPGARQSSFAMVENNKFFECPGLAPGNYTVVANIFLEDGRRLTARQDVDIVNSDVEVALHFSAPIDVSGTVRIDGAMSRPLQDLRIGLQQDRPSVDGGGASTTMLADGSFVMHNVIPDVYQLAFAAPQGTYMKSLAVGGQDVADRRVDLTKGAGPLAIVLGTDVGEVEGSVQNASGDPAVRVRVNLVPYGNHIGRQDLHKFAFTDEKGAFRIRSVAPGEYKLFAWEDVDVGAPMDPEFRKPFEKLALPLKVEPNAHESVKLKSINVAAGSQQ